jgi:fumarylacetoacetate (FAA) hydrolase
MVGDVRLASLRDGSRDGTLVVVDGAAERYAVADAIAPHLQAALDDWDRAAPELRRLAERLERDDSLGVPLDVSRLAAPLSRAYEWIDGSSFLNHVVLARRARGAEPPEDLESVPLVYQGGSSVLLAPHAPLPLPEPAWGLDFEAEICAVLGDVPQRTTAERAEPYVRLFLLANDVTFRNLVPPELKRGFGFFQSKPATAFSPFAVTPDELGGAFRDGRVHLRLRSTLNGELIGNVDAGEEMHFSFFDLIEHVSETRAFCAGTILGSGTASNRDRSQGVSCLAERRAIETIERGAPVTAFMKAGDRIRIEMFDAAGRSVFGAIDQVVTP